jgi:hypothetical protein
VFVSRKNLGENKVTEEWKGVRVFVVKCRGRE